MAKQMYERNQEMYRLRHSEGMTEQSIGDIYGISRERVRQIVGNTGHYFRREWTQKLSQSGKIELAHWKDLENAPGVKKVWKDDWGNHRHDALSGNIKMAQIFEELASSILSKYGVKNCLKPNRHPFDIETSGGARIDVKITNVDVSKMETQRSKHPTYQIPELKSGKDCDFFFIFVPDSGEDTGYTYFVIPSFEMKKYKKGSRIRIPWPPTNKTSKWQKYNKRVDLIT